VGSFTLSKNHNSGNSAFGYSALYNNTSGWDNVAIGDNSFSKNEGGGDGTACGTNAFYNNKTGHQNTGLGRSAGVTNISGSYLTMIGAYTDVTSSNLTNATAIGYNAEVNSSDKVVIGNASVSTIGGHASWTNYSDKRLKENIIYTNDLGLEFISKLKTVSYNYIDDTNKRRRDGLIAQDVQNTMEELGVEFSGLIIDEDPQQTLNLSYTEMVIPLINSVQELKAENETLEERINQLESLVNQMMEK